MQTFANCERINLTERTQRKIRQVLEICHGMRLPELMLRVGAPEALVRSHLEIMMRRGEIERLRPVDYAKDDNDFYALVRPLREFEEHPWDD